MAPKTSGKKKNIDSHPYGAISLDLRDT